jgi:hypothetical protein
MKTNSYIYRFSVPNIHGVSEQFQSSLDILGSDTLNASEIMNYILDSCIKDYNKKFDSKIERNQVLLEFVSLVNVV